MNKPSKEQLQGFGEELDAIRAETLADLGQSDADYIRKLMRRRSYAEVLGRGLILLGFNPVAWVVGVILLSVAKILDNMEIGHNIMHGQYDWMNDPKIHSQTHDWDNLCEPGSWRKTHNHEHHTYTNILGKDRDFGYGAYRMSEDMEWEPKHKYQVAYYGLMALLFQWGLGLHDLEAERIRSGEITRESKADVYSKFKQRMRKHLFKEYLLFPLLGILTGAGFLGVALANFIANSARNLWGSAVIFCGHFTDEVHTFTPEECENETQGEWYYRQILGSSNIDGGPLMHVMSGHLSLQIEHHLFPDIPAHRYQDIAPRVREICRRYGVPYNTGGFFTQYWSVIKRLHKFSKRPESAENTSTEKDSAQTA